MSAIPAVGEPEAGAADSQRLDLSVAFDVRPGHFRKCTNARRDIEVRDACSEHALQRHRDQAQGVTVEAEIRPEAVHKRIRLIEREQVRRTAGELAGQDALRELPVALERLKRPCEAKVE